MSDHEDKGKKSSRYHARGRFVSRSISASEQLAAVSFKADYLFGRMLPHLDVEGRLTGNPALIKSRVIPLRSEISEKQIPALLRELAGATDPDGLPLLLWYEVGGVKVLQFPRFAEHQKGLRKEREAPSKLPIYSSEAVILAGKPPEQLRSNSGPTPTDGGTKAGPNPGRGVVVVEVLGRDTELDDEVRSSTGASESGDSSLPSPPNDNPVSPSPRVELPEKATAFLAMFYEPAFTEAARERYLNVKRQLYDVIDPIHPGVKIRGGVRVRARDVEHFVWVLDRVMKDPPPNRDHAILWVLNKLLDAPPGKSHAELQAAEETQRRRLDERYATERKRAGLRWAVDNPEEYEKLRVEIDRQFPEKVLQSQAGKIARDSALSIKIGVAIGFPSFSEWQREQQRGTPVTAQQGAPEKAAELTEKSGTS